MAVRDPNVMPTPMVFLVVVSALFFVVAFVKQWVKGRPWRQVAKAAEPIAFDRKMVERMRQSGIERMPR